MVTGEPTRSPAIVLGTAQLRTSYGIARRTAVATVDEARALLETAVELGVAALDTAPGYGSAETVIGDAGCSLAVHTKIDPALSPAASLAGSLARLRRTSVDILYLHDPAAVLDAENPLLADAHELVGGGTQRLGASVYEPAEFDAAVADDRIGAIQVPLNILDRRIGADRLAAAAARDVEVYARSVLLQGVLAVDPEAVPPEVAGLRPFVAHLDAVAGALHRTRLELAVAWVRSQPGVHGLVLGAETVDDLRQLVAATRAEPLDAAELEEIGRIDTPPPTLCDPRRWAAA